MNRSRIPPPPQLATWALHSLEAHGLRPKLESLMRSIPGLQAIRGITSRNLHNPVMRELDAWCEHASNYYLDQQMQNPIERARLADQLAREVANGQISPAQYRQDVAKLNREFGGAPTDEFTRKLAQMSDGELRRYVENIPRAAAAAGLTPEQYLAVEQKVTNQGQTTKAFPAWGEAEAEQILAAIGGQRTPGLSAQATLFDYLCHFDEGHNIGARRLPFDGQPGLANREGMMNQLVHAVQQTPLGQHLRRTGQDVRPWLEYNVQRARQADMSDAVLARRAKEDVQRPRVEERPSRDQQSRDRLRGMVEAQVNHAEATTPRKKIPIDSSMELHVRNAYSLATGQSSRDFAKEISIPGDIGDKVLEHHDAPEDVTEERESSTSTGDLRTDVSNAFDNLH
jgi:hypothetical protein